MRKTDIKKSKIFRFFLVMALFLGAFIVFSQNVEKARSSDCDLLEGDEKKKCREYEKKAEAYQDLIEIKNKQQDTLQKQLDLIEMEQTKTRQDLGIIQRKADDLGQKIANLETQIGEKESSIKYQKSILTRLMQSYYEDYQEGVLNIVLINKSFYDILNQSDYVGQVSAKLKDVLITIEADKKDLEKEQAELADAKRENEEVKGQLEDKKQSLQSNEYQKQSLLTKTQGEEAKYQELLARVEQQKMELFNFGASGNAADVLASVSNYSKPDKKYWASTSWYFSQRDPKWANKTIGNSGSLMKDWGCAVSAVAMVFKYYGASIDPGKLAKQPIYYYDLIKWPASWPPDIELASSVAHTSVNWSKVQDALDDDKVVIVYVKKTNGGGGHYVVIHDYDEKKKDYVVHDPYFGSNLYLGTTRALMGAMNPKSGTALEQAIIYND